MKDRRGTIFRDSQAIFEQTAVFGRDPFGVFIFFVCLPATLVRDGSIHLCIFSSGAFVAIPHTKLTSSINISINGSPSIPLCTISASLQGPPKKGPCSSHYFPCIRPPSSSLPALQGAQDRITYTSKIPLGSVYQGNIEII